MTDFHINPDIAGTSGSGSAADPFKSWAQVSLPLSADDTVKFKRGSLHSYANVIDVWGAPNITLESYSNVDGTDNVTQPKPTLINSTNNSTIQAHITSSKVGMAFRNLILRDATVATARNLNITTDDYAVDSKFLIEGVEMYNAGLNNLRLFGKGVVVKDCIMDGADDDNVYSEGSFNEIVACNMKNPGRVSSGDNIQVAISVHSSNNYLIARNTLDTSDTIKQNIIFDGSSHYVLNNNCKSGAVGIYAKGSGNNSHIAGNVIHAGANLVRGVYAESNGISIVGNHIDLSSANPDLIETAIMGAIGNDFILSNNTIIGIAESDGIIILSTASGAVIRNSIITGCLRGLAVAPGTYNEAYNVFFDNANDVIETPSTVVAIAATSKNVNPELSNGIPLPTNANLYHAGESLPHSYKDMRGRPFNNPPTIGAYEFTSGSLAQTRTLRA